MEPIRSIRFTFREVENDICFPAKATYEEVVKIAMEHFLIPPKYKNYILVYAESEYGFLFDKQSFEKYLLDFPNPKIRFEIRLDYLGFWENRTADIYIQVPIGNPDEEESVDENANESTSRNQEFVAEC